MYILNITSDIEKNKQHFYNLEKRSQTEKKATRILYGIIQNCIWNKPIHVLDGTFWVNSPKSSDFGEKKKYFDYLDLGLDLALKNIDFSITVHWQFESSSINIIRRVLHFFSEQNNDTFCCVKVLRPVSGL